MAKKKYKRERSLGWLIDIDVKINDYKYIGQAVNHILKNDKNYHSIVKAMKKQIEDKDDDSIGSVSSDRLDEFAVDREELAHFITGRLRESKRIANSRHQNPSIYNLLKSEFRTEAYLSQEERAKQNLNNIFSHRTIEKANGNYVKSSYKYIKEREFFKERFGTTDLRKVKIGYYNELPIDMPLSYDSMDKGYYAFDKYGKKVIFEMLREKVGDTEYKMNIIIRYQDMNDNWHTL